MSEPRICTCKDTPFGECSEDEVCRVSYQRGLAKGREENEKLLATLIGILDHWHEFGPEYGLDEKVDQAWRRWHPAALRAEPAGGGDQT